MKKHPKPDSRHSQTRAKITQLAVLRRCSALRGRRAVLVFQSSRRGHIRRLAGPEQQALLQRRPRQQQRGLFQQPELGVVVVVFRVGAVELPHQGGHQDTAALPKAKVSVCLSRCKALGTMHKGRHIEGGREAKAVSAREVG